MGSIYLRGKTYWIQYYRNGKPYQESSKSKKKMVAKDLLKEKEGEIAQGHIPSIHFGKVTFDDLAQDLITDYELNMRKSLERMQISIEHLKSYFEGMKMQEIARHIGVTKWTVGSRLHYATRRLRQLIPDELNVFRLHGTYDWRKQS